MNFISAVHSGFHKLTVSDGRASRSEFWWFILFNIVVNIYSGIYLKVFKISLFMQLLFQLPLLGCICFLARNGIKNYMFSGKNYFRWTICFLALFFLRLLEPSQINLVECIDVFIKSIIDVAIIAISIRRLHDINKSGWQMLWWSMPCAVFSFILFAFSFYTSEVKLVGASAAEMAILMESFLAGMGYILLLYLIPIAYFIYCFCRKPSVNTNIYG